MSYPVFTLQPSSTICVHAFRERNKSVSEDLHFRASRSIASSRFRRIWQNTRNHWFAPPNPTTRKNSTFCDWNIRDKILSAETHLPLCQRSDFLSAACNFPRLTKTIPNSLKQGADRPQRARGRFSRSNDSQLKWNWRF